MLIVKSVKKVTGQLNGKLCLLMFCNAYCCVVNFALGGLQSIVMSMSVCLFVRLLAYLENLVAKFRQSFIGCIFLT